MALLQLGLYLQVEESLLSPPKREGLRLKISNLLKEFKNDHVYVIIDRKRAAELAANIPEQRIVFSDGSGNYTLPNSSLPFYILSDTSTHISRRMLLDWNEKISLLHGRKVVKVDYPFRASNLQASFRAFTSELTDYLSKKSPDMRSWLNFAPHGDFVTEDSLEFIPDHLREAYRRYREDIIFPESFMIEPTNSCTLKCVMCPYHSDIYKEAVKPPYIPSSRFSNMPFSLWKKIIDELAFYGVTSLVPQYRGEPYLNPDFTKMLKYARERGMSNIAFPTNGNHFTDEVIEQTLDADLACLIISFDALKKDTYLSIRKNSDYEKVISSAFKIRDRRNQRGLQRPELQVTFVEQDINRSEREEYIKFWTNEGFRVRVNISLSYDELRNEQPFYFTHSYYDHRPPCPLIVGNAAITSEGKMILCHTDSTETTQLGDVNKQSIKEIYDSALNREIMDAHMSGNFGFRDVCAKCQIWKADINRIYDDPEYNVVGGPWWINYEKKPPAPQRTEKAGYLRRIKQRILSKVINLSTKPDAY